MKKLGIILFCACGVAFAAGSGTQKWQATSTTAMSITGDVQLSGSALYFQNGKSLNLKSVARNDNGSRQVFKVEGNTNPVLNNGNYLCGPRPPAHLFVERTKTSMAIAVFESDQAPKLDFDVFMPVGACATYHYAR